MTTFGSLFSGGGGWDMGAVLVGMKPVLAVELDSDLARWHNRVFGAMVLTTSVADVPWNEVISKIPRVDVLVSAPPCQDYSRSGRMQASIAKSKGRERGDRTFCDPLVGLSTLDAVDALEPRVVLLEEAPAYLRSAVFAQIIRGLSLRGYSIDWKVLKMEDYGLPSGRERLIMRAVIGRLLPPWPNPRPRVSWFAAIADQIPSLPISEPAPFQRKYLAEWGLPRPGEPLLLSGGNKGSVGKGDARRWLVHRFPHELSWGIQKAKGTTSMRVVDADGNYRLLSTRAIATLGGFPREYPIESLPRTRALDIVGNAVPPIIAAQILAPFANGR